MKIYAVLCQDVHIDDSIRLFRKYEDAYKCAQEFLEQPGYFSKAEIEEEEFDGWIYFAHYGERGSVRIEEINLE